MNGLGRKLWLNKFGGGLMWEGQFWDSKFNGFGRQINFHHNNEYDYYIGMWKYGRWHGYGSQVNRNGTIYDGLYQFSSFEDKPVSLNDIKFYNA